MTARTIVPALALGVVMASLGATASKAEFFNDVKRTFQTDVPHFFQDDIPCAFGGQPTSGTKSACKGKSADPAKSPLRGEAKPTEPTQPAQQPMKPKPIPY